MTTDAPATFAMRPEEAAMTASADPRRWRALAVLALAQFMVVLDVTITNVALPAIQADLGFSPVNLSWVVGAYTLTFGGLLLLGGRMADLLGRRRMFRLGLVLFALASLLAGLATSSGLLVAARALQGIGAALLSPAALSMITVTFTDDRERGIALAVWGALAGLGGTAGVVTGGILIDWLGWEWVFFINVPIALGALAASPFTVSETRSTGAGRSFDAAGALLATLGVSAIVLGVIRSDALGWGATEVVALLTAGPLLLLVFALAETRAESPLVPGRLIRSRGLTVSSAALAINGGGFISTFYLCAIFLQETRGASSIETGLQFLPMGVTSVFGALLAQRMVARVGVRPVLALGAAVSAGSLLLLTGADPGESYAGSILPAFSAYGIGISLVTVAGQTGAFARVEERDAGSASGFLNAAFQLGAAIGLAVITTLANGRAEQTVEDGAALFAAQTAGFHHGITLAAALTVINVLFAASLRPRDTQRDPGVAARPAAAIVH